MKNKVKRERMRWMYGRKEWMMKKEKEWMEGWMGKRKDGQTDDEN